MAETLTPTAPVAEPPASPAASAAAGDGMTMAQRVAMQFPKSLGGQELDPNAPPPAEPGSTAPPEPAAPAAPAAPEPAAPAPATTEPGIIPDSVFDETPVKTGEDTDLEGKKYDAPEKIKNDPGQYENWNKVRRDLELKERIASRAEAKVAELQKQVENYKTDEGLKARVTELETQNADYAKRQHAFDLQNTQAFQNQFTAPRANGVKRALEIAKANNIDPVEVEKAFSIPNEDSRRQALDEILSGVGSESHKLEFGEIIRSVNRIDRDVAGALADAEVNLKRLREHEAAEQSRFMETYNKDVLSSVDRISEWLHKEKKIPFFGPVADENFKKIQVEANAEAKRILTESTNPAEHATAVVLGTMTEPIFKWGLNNHKRLLAALKEIDELKGADPTLNGRPRSDTTTDLQDKGLSFSEAAARASGLP